MNLFTAIMILGAMAVIRLLWISRKEKKRKTKEDYLKEYYDKL